jgi:aminopeptidase N
MLSKDFRLPNSLIILMLCFIQACQTTSKPDSKIHLREQSPSLHDSYASFRKQQILNVDYQLDIQLDAQQDVFRGQVILDFELAADNHAPITIDFFSGDILSLSVNGKSAMIDYKEWFITLAPELFQPGRNEVVIQYQTKYSSQGEGLHRYQDKQTGRIYLYTNFEPFSANKFFPHFDQPNLKARFTLSVTAPASWQVISAVRETSVVEQGDSQKWLFPQTAPIPSYIFPLHAGDYQMWEDKSGAIPLRLFARKELAQFVKPEEWFGYTQKSFVFFNEYFDYAYPFGKYDQIIVPEFNWGAMENLGAVTFAEKFITRGTRTETEAIALASVIAHEMAHMWFGNLATMDWWNGLWLNESFATYMAYLALARTEQVDGTWETFYSRIKQWAYLSDQQITTHAIELPVATTSDAFSNFDGITYGKGASLLKQLPYYLGEENFRQGVATYLKKYAYRNTILDNFIEELGKASNKDLKSWTHDWLYTVGLNSLQAEFSCSADGQWLKQLSLVQSAPEEFPILREQIVQVALFTVAKNDDQAKIVALIPVTYRDAVTSVTVADKTPCPDLVYPNFDDWGYVKVVLDSRSRETLEHHLYAFKDDTLRLMLWETYWDAVQDAQLPVTEPVDFVIKQLPNETNQKTIERVTSILGWSYGYLTALASVDEPYAPQRQAIETFFWQQSLMRAHESDQQKIFFQKFVATAHTNGALNNLRNLLTGEQSVPGLNLDQDLRWQILLRLNQFQYDDYLELTAIEVRNDGSQRGIQNTFVAEAIRPDLKIKQQWLDRIFTQDAALSLDQLRAVTQNLFPVEQNFLRAKLSEQIIERTIALNDTVDDQTMKNIGTSLAPNTCTKKSATQLAKVKDRLAELRPILGKSYRIAHHENERCLQIGRLLKQNLGKSSGKNM